MRRSLPPRFVIAHRASALGVAALGFSALWIGGELGPLVTGLAAAALISSAWGGRPRLKPSTWVAIQLLFVAWLAGGQVIGTTHVLTAFAQLLIFVQLHRLVTRRSARDDLYSYFIAFGQLLLASVLTVDVAFLLVFVGFLVVLTWAMLLTRLALATERDHARRRPGLPIPASEWHALAPLVRPTPFLVVGSLTVGLLIGTLALFFILPRLEASFLSASLLPPIHVSGFSEEVRLGELGLLQLSNEPVMRVRTYGPDGDPVSAEFAYWHGLAMDRFDGRAWSLSDPRTTRLGWIGGRDSRGPPRSRSWNIRSEVTVEALDSRVLFNIAEATGIYGDFRAMEAVETAGFYFVGARRRQSYTVYSEPLRPSLEQLRDADPRLASDDLLQTYTQLPASLSPVVGRLATEWSRGASSPADAALLIQRHLREDFTYSLEQPAAAYPDPLEAFLVDVREGHCEYFATAMVLMMRTQGVPARIVNGFQGGQWNPVGEYWLVRQRDAHSWVEVWFPDVGWVIFDPTASGGVSGRARIRLLARIGAWADYGRHKWAEVMLDYGLNNQAEGVRAALSWLSDGGGGLRLGGGGGREREPAGERARAQPRAIGVGLALIAVVLLLLVVVRRGVPSPTRTASPELRRVARLVAKLERRWRRASVSAVASTATTLALAEEARYQHPGQQSAPQTVGRYYSARFGGGPVPSDLQAELKSLIRATPRRFGPTRR